MQVVKKGTIQENNEGGWEILAYETLNLRRRRSAKNENLYTAVFPPLFWGDFLRGGKGDVLLICVGHPI